jgi:hypothetical protein
VENAFGLLAVRWRILLKPIETRPELADKITIAACALHNFLLTENGIAPGMVDRGDEENGQWRRVGQMQQADNLGTRMANRARNNAIEIRENLVDFYNNQGAVEWQQRYLDQY